MTTLRQRMIDARVLRGFRPRTQVSCLRAVSQMARHYHRSPELITDQEVQAYLLHLVRDRQRARTSVNLVSSATRFLICEVLGQADRRARIPMALTPQRLPEVLSRAEVAAVLAAPLSLKARTLLMTAYATGMRVSELCSLRGCDIDSSPERMRIRVVAGKGGHDRYSLLSTPQARVWRAIVACRTPALGGQLQRCERCGQEQRMFRSRRNRHCPQCQHHARDAWRQARLAELLPVPYCHLMFTLPHALNGLTRCHDRWVCRTLMQCVAAASPSSTSVPKLRANASTNVRKVRRVAECDAKLDALLSPLAHHDVKLVGPAKRAGKNTPGFDLRTALARWARVDLTRINGLAVTSVLAVLSEIGPDLSRFANVKYFCSWLDLCPGTKISGGKVLSTRTRRSTNRVRQALKLAAMSLSRNSSALGAFYRRRCTRMDKPRANTAVAHKLARMVYFMLTRGEDYVDQGQQHYEEQQRQRSIAALRRRAADLGFAVAPKAATA